MSLHAAQSRYGHAVILRNYHLREEYAYIRSSFYVPLISAKETAPTVYTVRVYTKYIAGDIGKVHSPCVRIHGRL